MKKLLLLAAGALLSSSAMMAEDWAIIGESTSWGVNNDYIFTADGDAFVLEVANLLNSFKVVPLNADNSPNWDYCYSTETLIQLGKSYTLDARDGGDDLGNMGFADDIMSVSDATITWNPSTAAFMVTGTPNIQSNDGSVIYIIGSPSDWNINADTMPLRAISEGIYQGVYEMPVKDGLSFRFYTKLGNWEANSIGSQVPDQALDFEMVDGIYSGPCVEGKGSWRITNWEDGLMTLRVNLNDMTVTFLEGDQSSDTGAVKTVGVDLNAPAVYYNLQGVRVNNPQKGGLYIIKQGDKTVKSIVR